MGNTVTAIELGSKKIKLVIGYELNSKVYSIYTLSKAYGELKPSDDFFDYSKLVETVNSIKDINDSNLKFSKKINQCALCLPPVGLEIYRTEKSTTVVSDLGKITPLDVKNLYAIIKNSNTNTEKTLIDIIPETYVLDNSRNVANIPLGDVSRSLGIKAKVHLCPEHIYKNYTTIFENAKIDIKRLDASPLGAVEYLSTLKDIPAEYFLFDIGSDLTSVSLVANNSLFAVKTMNWGGDKITKSIAEKFGISIAEAEKYKKIYGIDKREMNFKAPICSNSSVELGNVHYYKEDLNKIINDNLTEFLNMFKKEIEPYFSNKVKNYGSIPVILVGGGSQLRGLVEFLSGRLTSAQIKTVVPETIGARDATYMNCLGMILIASKYMSLNEEKGLRASGMTRD